MGGNTEENNKGLSMKSQRNSHLGLIIIPTTVLVASLVVPAWAASKNKLDARVRDLTDYFDKVQQEPKKAVPGEILGKAQGLIIMRNYKAGLIVGISGGHGLAIVKDKTTGQWGPIGFVRAGEGSFGFQAGAQRNDEILVLMNADGIKVLTDPNFKLGVDVRATVGPKSAGDQANFKTDKTPILAYGDTRGLYGGASLETGGVFPDAGDNETYYGKKVSMSEILVGGQVEPTEAAKLLGAKIEQYAKPATLARSAVPQEQKPSTPVVDQEQKPLTAEDSVLVYVTAKVDAIDHATREITLKNDIGNVATFTVDKRVQRLDDVQEGDTVSAAYYISVAGELRPPTEEEKENPIEIQEGAARAPQGTEPAAGSLRVIKVVTTVAGIDLPTQTVTLKGPMGNNATIRAKNVENLKKLHLDDTIVVTYTEALGIAVDKVPPSKQ
jgi:lipid-binding SYLF domain-containing protein